MNTVNLPASSNASTSSVNSEPAACENCTQDNPTFANLLASAKEKTTPVPEQQKHPEENDAVPQQTGTTGEVDLLSASLLVTLAANDTSPLTGQKSPEKLVEGEDDTINPFLPETTPMLVSVTDQAKLSPDPTGNLAIMTQENAAASQMQAGEPAKSSNAFPKGLYSGMPSQEIVSGLSSPEPSPSPLTAPLNPSLSTLNPGLSKSQAETLLTQNGTTNAPILPTEEMLKAPQNDSVSGKNTKTPPPVLIAGETPTNSIASKTASSTTATSQVANLSANALSNTSNSGQASSQDNGGNGKKDSEGHPSPTIQKAKPMGQAALQFQTMESADQNTMKSSEYLTTGSIMTSSGEITRPAGIAAPPLSTNNPALPQVPLNSLAVHIAAQANAGHQRFDIRLDPPELGRIDIRLEIGRDGQTITHLVVEKPETLDMLRQDVRQLERALTNAGLDSRNGSLSFSLREDNQNRQQQAMKNQQDSQQFSRDNGSEQNDIPEPVITKTLNVSPGLDISI
jgi:flagellar hook-length control protein FliK